MARHFNEMTGEEQDEFLKYWEEEQEKKKRRPQILPNPAPIYETEYSEIPEKIRVSFSNSKTAVYELRIDQPHPLVLKNIEIMKETKKNITQGYVNNPMRRRRRNRT